MTLRTIAIVPARMNSGRFPGKPLKTIDGMSMVGHCTLRTRLCKTLTKVVVATPNEEVAADIRSLGGEVVVTPEFDMCNDRIAWAYEEVAKTDGPYDLVINVQGDQPLVHPDMLDQIIAAHAADPGLESSTLVEPLTLIEEFHDLNRVKVLFRDSDGGLIYMSRAPIPSPKKHGVLPERVYKHTAIIAFKPAFLKEFLAFGMTYNEEVEGIDYNRVIEMGRSMKVLVTPIVSDTVDNAEDLARVTKTMATDPLWNAKAYGRS
ncbi:3-deoxy-manno-octulosonate cytidylyltransferase [Paramagnetospirillum magnetotacticum MS-1]|uniref:3-deoxy-manno-octulosonate cytidylyltransferase n=1 Tax=Paramagnetospirillum magnetotacticum MS-1 TaxID=272627 RepID=A0A0C2YDJ5_PARME|nr:3-deoxy-manno-octulosonate cytidylyltransferase [Paramagnetospirillum magnetotacticum]KIL97789.1 3-deoxy-manno-octulosonate cytidylyltransferase [Paramagnetospirillum magnetotacticum MS-1]